MKFIHRKIENTILQACENFPAVVLMGLRRAGKTFLLRNIFPNATYVQLEDPDVLLSVKEDPRGFLSSLKLPVIIDEIQQVPELFSYVRSRIDVNPEIRGQWILTGSQESLLLGGVSESMAGRAAILHLAPFSSIEDSRVNPFVGGYAEALAMGTQSGLWYSSYIQTYLERDVRSILAIRNLMTFHRFLKILATRHGQMLNKTAMAAPLGVSVPTLTEWLGVLEMSGLITLVSPYYRNAGKRLVKTPKVYFLDSGLACYLLNIRSAKALKESPFYGAIFEGFVISEVLKAQWASGSESEVYYFRDEQGVEVDLLYPAQDGRLTMVECKSSSTVTPEMTKTMRQLAKSFGSESIITDMYLVHNPVSEISMVKTVGENVQAISVGDFVKKL